MTTDLSTALRVSDRSVSGQYADAQALVARFLATVQAWADGVIRRGHVAVLDRHGVAESGHGQDVGQLHAAQSAVPLVGRRSGGAIPVLQP